MPFLFVFLSVIYLPSISSSVLFKAALGKMGAKDKKKKEQKTGAAPQPTVARKGGQRKISRDVQNVTRINNEVGAGRGAGVRHHMITRNQAARKRHAEQSRAAAAINFVTSHPGRSYNCDNANMQPQTETIPAEMAVLREKKRLRDQISNRRGSVSRSQSRRRVHRTVRRLRGIRYGYKEIEDVNWGSYGEPVPMSIDHSSVQVGPCFVEIDEEDLFTERVLLDYVEDILSTHRKMEILSCISADNWRHSSKTKRLKAFKFLHDMHGKMGMKQETLHLCMNLFDRYISISDRSKLEEFCPLVAITSMFMASKYEEVWPAEIYHLIRPSLEHVIKRENVIEMERVMLRALDYEICAPNVYTFVKRFIKLAGGSSKVVHLAFYYCELSLSKVEMLAYWPSLIAASTVYAAKCAFRDIPCWNDMLSTCTGYTENDIMECAMLIARIHKNASRERHGIFKKYSLRKYRAVALVRPYKLLLD